MLWPLWNLKTWSKTRNSEYEKFKERGSFTVFRISLGSLLCSLLTQSYSYHLEKKFHMKAIIFGVKKRHTFTSADIEFILAEDLDTHYIVHVCMENNVPEKEIKITKKGWVRTFAHITDILDDSHFGSFFKVSTSSKLKSKQERERKMKERNSNDRLKNDTHKTIKSMAED